MRDQISLDFITNGQAFGSAAQKLLNSRMDVGSLRPYVAEDGRAYVTVNGQAIPVVNATLRKDEWKQYDQAVIQVTQERLIGIADLNSRGLTYSIPSGMGKTVLEYEDATDINDATMNMDGLVRGTNDQPEWVLKYLPLPIVHADFQLNMRQLEASRNTGAPLDTVIAQMKARKVAEKLESMLFMGSSSYAFGGGTIYGYTDHPNRNTYTLNTHWNDSGATGSTILADVLGMKQKLVGDGYYGPYVVYIPTNYETKLDDDFKANSDLTVRQRILQIGGIQDIKVADMLTGDNVVMVQMTSDVVRMVNGLPITTLQWDEQGGLVTNFKIMTIQVPQIRATSEGDCGICHATK